MLIQRERCFVHELPACPVENLHQDVDADDHDGEHGQRHVIATRDDPAIDFHHVARRRQYQQAGEKTEKGGPFDEGAKLVNGLAQF